MKLIPPLLIVALASVMSYTSPETFLGWIVVGMLGGLWFWHEVKKRRGRGNSQ